MGMKNFIKIWTAFSIILIYLRMKVSGEGEPGRGWGIRHNHNHPHHQNNWKVHHGQGHHPQHFRPHHGGFGGSVRQKVGVAGSDAFLPNNAVVFQRFPSGNANHPHFSIPFYGGGYPHVIVTSQGQQKAVPSPPKPTISLPQESHNIENPEDSSHSVPPNIPTHTGLTEEPQVIVDEAGPIFPPSEEPLPYSHPHSESDESLIPSIGNHSQNEKPTDPEAPLKPDLGQPKPPHQTPQNAQKLSEQTQNSSQEDEISDYDFSKLIDVRGNFNFRN